MLLVDEKKQADSEKPVLAVLSNYAESGCWRLEDIRLTKDYTIDRYWASAANSFTGTYKPEDADEASYVKAKLREYQETKDGVILWSPFNGVVKGEPSINGYTPKRWADFDQTGYFSRTDGLAKLMEIQAFWESLPSLSEINESDWRLPNPHAQPSESDIQSLCSMRRVLYLTGKITEDAFREIERKTLSHCSYLQNKPISIIDEEPCFLIQSKSERAFWSNDDGWTEASFMATRFYENERSTLSMPMSAGMDAELVLESDAADFDSAEDISHDRYRPRYS